MSIGKISIKREAPSLICTHSHTLVLHKRKKGGTKKGEDLCLWCFGSYAWGFVSLSITPCPLAIALVIYIEEFCVGLFPLGFPRVNCCVPCDCVSFSDPLYGVIVKMY